MISRIFTIAKHLIKQVPTSGNKSVVNLLSSLVKNGYSASNSGTRLVNNIDKHLKKFNHKNFQVLNDLAENNFWQNTKMRSSINQVLLKNFYDKKLSSNERDLLNLYERFTDNEHKVEIQYVKSSWIIKAQYIKKSKEVYVWMVRSRKIYVFYNVPRTKWLALTKIGGKYMWDYFGKHYSTNPTHWLRGIRR